MLEGKFWKRDGDRVSSAAERELLNFRQVIICLCENEPSSQRMNVLQQRRVWNPRSEFTVRQRVFPTECTSDEEALEFQCRLTKRGSVIRKVADYNVKVSVYYLDDRRCPASFEEVFVIQHPQRGGSQVERCVIVIGHPSAAKTAIVNRHNLRDEHFKTE